MLLKSSTPLVKSDNDLLIGHLPDDSSLQTYAMKEALSKLLTSFPPNTPVKVVDLGCGTGTSYNEFKLTRQDINWIGLDIADSPEVRLRVRNDLNFKTYDGLNLPFPDNSVDLIYSHQVFEHVRYPEGLLHEVKRVLKEGGFFIGSTSCLEPYHSYSLWNYTPLGFITILKSAGFDSIIIKPGIDCLTLIIRRLLGYLKLGWILKPFFMRESPLNCIIEILTRTIGVVTKRRAALKLVFSGHFIFIVYK
jgi:SAM-dependent methyltransferase